jgi:uncharacterized damage-inducible protein DinB
MRTFSGALLICLAVAAPAAAQENPLSAHSKGVYSGAKTIILAATEKMPEENYGFKPIETVRSYGQVIGHIADSQYYFCSAVIGETNPAPKVEKTKTSKAELVAALKEAFAYCDKAYDGMTDKAGIEMIKHMGGDSPKLGVLNVNLVHTIEHYGNLVTYLRMKGLVPPSSDPELMKGLMKK